jgi:hypothetical protein
MGETGKKKRGKRIHDYPKENRLKEWSGIILLKPIMMAGK